MPNPNDETQKPDDINDDESKISSFLKELLEKMPQQTYEDAMLGHIVEMEKKQRHEQAEKDLLGFLGRHSAQ